MSSNYHSLTSSALCSSNNSINYLCCFSPCMFPLSLFKLLEHSLLRQKKGKSFMDIGHGLMIDISAHCIRISMQYTLQQNEGIYSCCFFFDIATASLHGILNEKSPSAHCTENKETTFWKCLSYHHFKLSFRRTSQVMHLSRKIPKTMT